MRQTHFNNTARIRYFRHPLSIYSAATPMTIDEIKPNVVTFRERTQPAIEKLKHNSGYSLFNNRDTPIRPSCLILDGWFTAVVVVIIDDVAYARVVCHFTNPYILKSCSTEKVSMVIFVIAPDSLVAHMNDFELGVFQTWRTRRIPFHVGKTAPKTTRIPMLVRRFSHKHKKYIASVFLTYPFCLKFSLLDKRLQVPDRQQFRRSQQDQNYQ